MSGLSPQTVILVHHHALLRDGIAALLEAEGFQVIARVGDGLGLLTSLERHDPTMILVEWDAPGIDEGALEGLSAAHPQTIVVLITRPESSGELGRALDAGVTGCLSVNLDREDFVGALRVLARGDMVVSQEMSLVVLEQELPAETPLSRLTPRELEVLRLVADGASNREIGQRLSISPHTAKVHVRHLLTKLGLRNRQQAAAFAAAQRITDGGSAS